MYQNYVIINIFLSLKNDWEIFVESRNFRYIVNIYRLIIIS